MGIQRCIQIGTTSQVHVAYNDEGPDAPSGVERRSTLRQAPFDPPRRAQGRQDKLPLTTGGCCNETVRELAFGLALAKQKKISPWFDPSAHAEKAFAHGRWFSGFFSGCAAWACGGAQPFDRLRASFRWPPAGQRFGRVRAERREGRRAGDPGGAEQIRPRGGPGRSGHLPSAREASDWQRAARGGGLAGRPLRLRVQLRVVRRVPPG